MARSDFPRRFVGGLVVRAKGCYFTIPGTTRVFEYSRDRMHSGNEIERSSERIKQPGQQIRAAEVPALLKVQEWMACRPHWLQNYDTIQLHGVRYEVRSIYWDESVNEPCVELWRILTPQVTTATLAAVRGAFLEDYESRA